MTSMLRIGYYRSIENCLQCNRCSYTEEDLKDFHILLGNVREEEISMMPAASQEMFNCFCKVCMPVADCSW